ncbi:MAG: hypothetical protein U1F68_18195 [Gammaproteobacteria bacterium]
MIDLLPGQDFRLRRFLLLARLLACDLHQLSRAAQGDFLLLRELGVFILLDEFQLQALGVEILGSVLILDIQMDSCQTYPSATSTNSLS